MPPLALIIALVALLLSVLSLFGISLKRTVDAAPLGESDHRNVTDYDLSIPLVGTPAPTRYTLRGTELDNGTIRIRKTGATAPVKTFKLDSAAHIISDLNASVGDTYEIAILNDSTEDVTLEFLPLLSQTLSADSSILLKILVEETDYLEVFEISRKNYAVVPM